MSRPELLAFDMDETLLDVSPLLDRIEDAVGAPARDWLNRTLHATLVANEIGAYRPFDQIATEVLIALGRDRGLSVSERSAADVVATMTRLPVKAGVYNSLERLFDAGFDMIALTNASTPIAHAQIEHAGLHVFLQRVISVDEVGLFKPAAEVYAHAAQAIAKPIRSVMVVAANDWDCAGAIACGARAALVKRPRAEWALPTPPPEVTVHDLPGLAELLVGVRSS
jgi:2-haloacid dehalogenase